MTAKKVEAYLSGGASNTNPNASLGGVISATKLYGQAVSYSTTSMAGITLLDGASLPANVDLHFDFSTSELYVTESPQFGTEIRVDVSVDDEYVLHMPGDDSTMTVSVVSASLPAADEMHTVSASAILHNLFDLVSSAESKIGDINYRHVYFKNITPSVIRFGVSVLSQLNGMDYIEIGVENSTAGTTDTLLANESTAPVGVSFSAPTYAGFSTLLEADPNLHVGIFLKRTVLALTDLSTPEDSLTLALTEFTA